MLNAWEAQGGDPQRDARTNVVVVGGGFSGTLFALAAAAARLDVVLVEREAKAGPGLAYGACDPRHLLNVPVARMEVGLKPSFAQWLKASGADLSAAIEEAGGDLARAFVPRALFGAYLAERLETALAARNGRLRRVRGEVVRVSDRPVPSVTLSDGRRIEGTHVVLATGNLPPRPPRTRDGGVYDSPLFVPDPWRWQDIDTLSPDAPVLLIGSGLTMVDVALMLEARGHRGPIWSVSRHGLVPHVHADVAGRLGGVEPFLDPAEARDPIRALRLIRGAVRQAAVRGVPWQRVMDAARPALAAVWAGWPQKARERFLRHGRTWWDIHRHRMAPRIADAFGALVQSGQLTVIAGRIASLDLVPGGVAATLRRRHSGRALSLEVARVVNCTGPRSDFAGLAVPPFDGLRETGRIRPDPLGLGLETRGTALLDRYGHASTWLHALGPLSRPAFWEVTAVPEIAVQVHQLVEELARPASRRQRPDARLIAEFVDLGEGI
ncbi:putative NAD(P)/FAD-binding protein YdhS [Xanthobacter sp. SG618]|uniref:FAD/NAD(P)-binding protein n=1 Tax=Xanthobacter sp. SG618 TaxID=2587121 RepID=UPI00145DCB20|nr:FAD/NAD(P)-binding protein [Xanthobacter sp. SG618]NMN60677.1 putative NAD(P)/FAD-binding protein YdhS [Xanthobacter sp. SG618]